MVPAATFTTSVVVPWPEVIVTPEGTVQLYEVTPATAATEYVAVLIPQTTAGPEILPVNTGGVAYKILLVAPRDPQPLFATTDNVPVVKLDVGLTVKEVVPCPET